jgi:hypothetical protein
VSDPRSNKTPPLAALANLDPNAPPADSISGSILRKQRDAPVEAAVQQRAREHAAHDAKIRRFYYGTGDELEQRRAEAAAKHAKGEISLDEFLALSRAFDDEAAARRAAALAEPEPEPLPLGELPLSREAAVLISTKALNSGPTRLVFAPSTGTRAEPIPVFDMTGGEADLVRQWAAEAQERGVPVVRCEDMARHQLAEYVVVSGDELAADPRWLLRVRWGPNSAVRLLTDEELGPLPEAEKDDPCPNCGSERHVIDERGIPQLATCLDCKHPYSVRAVDDEFGRRSWKRRRPEPGSDEWSAGTGVTVL